MGGGRLAGQWTLICQDYGQTYTSVERGQPGPVYKVL